MPLRNSAGIPINPRLRTSISQPLEARVMALDVVQPNTVIPWQNGFRLTGFNWIIQRKANWCWAACTDMVLDFYGRPEITQCYIANQFFHKNGNSSCCLLANHTPCNEGCDETDIDDIYRIFNIRSSFRNGRISFAEIISEINAGRPVQVGYGWDGGGYHVAVVTGWRRTATANVVYVYDPVDHFGHGQLYFDDLLTAYDKGEWIWTWTRLEKV